MRREAKEGNPGGSPAYPIFQRKEGFPMGQSFIPAGYAPHLSLYETQSAISLIKRVFQDALSRVHKAVFKNRFQKYTGSGRLAGNRHHRRLKIGREAGVDHRSNLKGLRRSLKSACPSFT